MRALLVALLLSTQTAQPILLTSVGRQLTADDISQIEALSQGIGRGRPWLLMGSASMIGRSWFVQAFLPPVSAQNGIRRGEFIGVQVDLPEDLSQRKAWGYAWAWQSYGEYAQVAVTGRSFDDILDDQDVNRPFRLAAEFSDEELLSIVGFIRTEARRWTEREQPILIISRSSLRPRGFPVVNVGLGGVGNLELRRDGDSWAVVAQYSVLQ